MRFIAYFLLLMFAICTPLGAAHADEATFYIVTNKAEGNSVVGYQKQGRRYQNIGEFQTGGTGTGDLEVPALEKDETHPLANGDDPLISANSIAATADRSKVVVVNPGNASLSLMRVEEDYSLVSTSTAEASDPFPISVAIFGDMVVAASVGVDNGHGSISAFRIEGDKLVAVEGSRRDLQARPSTIAFSSDGEHVIVNELVTGKIKIFEVADNSFSAEPVSMIDSPRANDERFQAIPVGFAVRGNGGDDVILMSEARFLTPDFMLRSAANETVLSPLYSWQTGSMSSYALRDDGQISLLSADVLTGDAIEGGEIANCWVALSADGTSLYAANALSSSISRFDIDSQGHAFLDELTAYKDESEALFFSDIEVSSDGKELYQLVGNKGEVMIFSIRRNGKLRHKQTVGGLPELGTYGMLVF